VYLSGLEPERDIEMRVVGLRPGEKMYEELWEKDEKPAHK
jgi:O-antigen biosynthesis protein WbqV